MQSSGKSSLFRTRKGVAYCFFGIRMDRKYFEDLQFKVFKNGKIKRFGVEKSQRLSNRGYKRISFWIDIDGERKKVVITSHQLVALFHITNTNIKQNCINHKNGDKTDNRVSNLEWVTALENNTHSIIMGLSPSVKIDAQKAKEIFNSNESVYNLSKKYKISTVHILRIKALKRWRSVNGVV